MSKPKLKESKITQKSEVDKKEKRVDLWLWEGVSPIAFSVGKVEAGG
jgi:hypothetical protein